MCVFLTPLCPATTRFSFFASRPIRLVVGRATWLAGVTLIVKALDMRLSGRGFESRPFRFQLATSAVEWQLFKAFTIEFYTVVMLLTCILIIISISSPPLFHSRLKTFLFCNPFRRSLPFFFRTGSTGSPDCLPILLSIYVFKLFLFFPLF